MNEFFVLHPHVSLVFLGVFSLAVGSLLNVVIYRVPLMLQREWGEQCRQLLQCPVAPTPDAETRATTVNLFVPRSFCPACKTPIPAWHNIPLFSYVFLRGRCHQCKTRIPLQYPLVEALCLGLSLGAGLFFGFTPTLLFALPFIWLLICISVIDLQHQLVPDTLSLSLLWLGLIANTQTLFTTLPNAVFSAVGAYVGLWLFIKLFYVLTGKIGMGHGDFKLFAAFGAWFGWTQLPLILFMSSLMGAVVGVIYLKISGQTRETPIPFGPFLCVAGLVSLFLGPVIIGWYVR